MLWRQNRVNAGKLYSRDGFEDTFKDTKTNSNNLVNQSSRGWMHQLKDLCSIPDNIQCCDSPETCWCYRGAGS